MAQLVAAFNMEQESCHLLVLWFALLEWLSFTETQRVLEQDKAFQVRVKNAFSFEHIEKNVSNWRKYKTN